MSGPSTAMMMMQSPHRDVLEATPDTDDSKAKLVEELLSRGRAAVGAKSWMDAKLLYEKALTVINDDANRKAILNSNLSLVEKNMGNFEAARKAADNATKEDPTYVKGWWRLGQALCSLHRPKEALEALNKAKFLEPTNKALIKEAEKVQKQVDEEVALMEVDGGEDEAMPVSNSSTAATTTATTNASNTPTNTKTNTTTKSTGSSSTPSSSSATNKMDVDGDDEDTSLFTKSEPVRGYKVVNGKKTSYFHNELDEKAKALIGDIAPKKLDNPSAATTNASAAKQGTSAWNQAGTWEEKDVSQWAKDTLTKAILQTTFTLPASSPVPNALVTVQKVKSLDGHASVAVVRGKTRFIYEYSCQLEWQLEQNDGDLECKGSLAIPDIDGTIGLGEGYEIHEFAIDTVNDNAVKPVIDRFVHRGGFHEALNESIDDWVRLFRKEFGPKDS
ncbi:activator of Hsp90 ATPase [Nitzschia inconspicua]|uniref:Activator of Hsp90 ATPase n=1 Tax=Nitzschia inconspicua TaxID=303405 RepID=A0A9K3LRF8_9STRA|nr:activator of Hsp90 ATPase [Nitzschia inconspicua]